MVNAATSESLKLFANRLRKALEDSRPDGLVVTGSFGATLAAKTDTITTLIKRSDEALYQAKGQGRNCVVYTVPMG